MLLTLICAAVCFAAAIIMFSAYYRKMTLLRPLAVYLVFMGAMTLFGYIISELNPTSVVADTITRIGTIVIMLYYIFILLMTKTKSKRRKRILEGPKQ